MFGLGLATKIYVAVEGVDMRKGFEGLYGLVRDQVTPDYAESFPAAGPAEAPPPSPFGIVRDSA